MSQKFTELRVTAKYDDYSAEDGWDGDYPLDPNKNWTPYILSFEGLCASCDNWTEIDSIGSVWISNDTDGRAYLESCIDDYFTVPEGFTRDDIDVQSPV